MSGRTRRSVGEDSGAGEGLELCGPRGLGHSPAGAREENPAAKEGAGKGEGRGGTRGGAACVRVPRRRGPCGVLAVARLAQSRVDAECSPSALPWEGKVRAAPRRCIRAASGRPGPPLPSHRPRGLLVRRSRGSSWASGLRGNETGQVGAASGQQVPGFERSSAGFPGRPAAFLRGLEVLCLRRPFLLAPPPGSCQVSGPRSGALCGHRSSRLVLLPYHEYCSISLLNYL